MILIFISLQSVDLDYVIRRKSNEAESDGLYVQGVTAARFHISIAYKRQINVKRHLYNVIFSSVESSEFLLEYCTE